MLIFEITDFWYFADFLVQISPNIKTWLFLKCTWKGVSKNAQDGFSRPLGSGLILCQTLERFL